MNSTSLRLLSVACVCAALGGCSALADSDLTPSDRTYAHVGRATTPNAPLADPTLFPDDTDDTLPGTVEGPRLQCVPYARDHSGINIHGDAYTWWDKAAGVYARGSEPLLGSVLVMTGYAGKHRAHVAVVRRIVSPREIRIDHANWLDDGAIYVNDPVVDVSENNDWSIVKVWNIRTGSWGTKTYRVQGFIGPGPDNGNAVVAAYHPPADDPIGRQIAASDRDADETDDDR